MAFTNISVCNLLREVVAKLNIMQEHAAHDISGMDERELVSLISQHYEVDKDEMVVERSLDKRKQEHENGAVKKLKVDPEVTKELCSLEMLPNEVYEEIMNCLGVEDQKNLRTTCKGLYEKTTLMSKTFQYWCFNFSKGSLPDFVLEDKPFYIKSSLNYANDDSYLINRFAHRINRLEINTTHMLMMNLKNMKMSEFPCLHTLDLKSVSFDNNSLIMLSPQLEILNLSSIKTKFDITAVKKDDRCFTKLKVLKIEDCHIDEIMILSKCCKTLKHLELGHKQLKLNKYLEHQLSSIKYIEMSVTNIPQQSKVRKLLSKASASLRTLILHDKSVNPDFGNLLKQTMAITTLMIESKNGTELSNFLNECPKIQKLILIGYQREVNQVLLEDLITVKFDKCAAGSVSSFLKKASKSSLKNLEIIKPEKDLTNFEFLNFYFTRFSKLENVSVDRGNINYYSKSVDQVIKLFPENAQVAREMKDNKAVYRRVYNIR